MQSFSFKSNLNENENVEKLIKERNRKIARQQVIFAIILLIIIGLLVWYLFRKTIYTEFDGFMHTEYKDYRAVEDIYLFDQYTEEGDIVVPGDTLYSYTYINMFGSGNGGSQPDIFIKNRDLRLQRDNAYNEANVLKVRIAELEAQIQREDNNIRFGMTDNSHKMDLERQLAVAKAELTATLNRAYRLGSIHNENNTVIAGAAQYGIDFSNEQWGLDHALRQLYESNAPIIRYAVAQDTAIVTKIWAPSFSRVFKKEHILQLEELSFEKSNVQVIAWVPTQDMGKINNNTRAEIIVNDDVSFMASVQLLGARTEDLPEELRNNLSHTYTAVMVVFAPDRDQVLPLWAVVDRVPVRVRIKNYENGYRGDGSDYWYIDNDGLTDISKHFLGLIRERSKGRYRYDPNKNTESPVQDPPAKTEGKKSPESPVLEKKTDTLPDSVPQNDTTSSKLAYHLHTIKDGETLYGLSQQYKVSINKILDLNPDIDKRFKKGAKVKIPVLN
ncbi:MAG: LysM peptidoglycan-binding domain-containing protein [Muribaculaceae bacterium]|nr:LysM peptidoglycan-binding domain-containing protein [Muribaculaceae bacterium]